MKAILEFNLPEDTQEHWRAVNAYQAWAALSEIRLMIRNHVKHDIDTADMVIDKINHIVLEAESWIGD